MHPTLQRSLIRISRLASLVSIGLLFLVNVALADNLPPRAYEKRTYTATDGNLKKLHNLFRQHSGRYFVRHGIQVIAVLIPTEESAPGNTVVWVLAHASEEDARDAWGSFNQDPKWLELLEEANTDGEIIEKIDSEFFLPADYSPMQ